jgi:DNA topoisomerase-6 subunit B
MPEEPKEAKQAEPEEKLEKGLSGDETRIAQSMAGQQREIAISEFFHKNRHLLGYDNKLKALLTIVKEAVDNALDATEEARILPEIYIKIEEAGKEKYRIVIRDNGPGVVKKQISNIFGRLLYGSKFHRLRQSRGQQGIGVSGCVLYAQTTTGEPTTVITSTGDGKTHKYKLKIDVKKNEPVIVENTTIEGEKWHGVQVTFVAEGLYREHKQSVAEYLKQTAISNPYAHIVFDSPNGRLEFHKGVEKLPKEPKEIQPHLDGTEVGVLTRMLQDTKARTFSGFLTTEFTRVGKTTAMEIARKSGIDPLLSPKKLEHPNIVAVIDAIKETKLTRPPTDCLSPLGDQLVANGLEKELSPEFTASVSRPPSVYRGWPFQVEVGIAYGGAITEPKLMRFANRVPLLYQAGDCAISKAVGEVDWKRYGLPANILQEAPVAIFVHMASVWVPFTSESKEAIANYPEIIKEMKLGLQEASRKLGLYLSGVRRAEAIAERKQLYEKYAEETALAIQEITGRPKEEVRRQILKMVEARWSEVVQEEPENGGPQANGEARAADEETGEGEDGESEESREG